VRHGFSNSAVAAAWDALRSGGGGMAQFDHPELGGAGQWMSGMVMIGRMSDHALKARVDALFHELRRLAEAGRLEGVGAGAPATGPSRPDASGGSSLRYGARASEAARWYPAELGAPASSGGQNGARYAYFPETRRLAIELGGRVTIYDTGPHTISGVAQDQSGGEGGMTFKSQLGVVRVSELPVVRSTAHQ